MAKRSPKKYAPGDRVVALRWPHGTGGVMIKPAPRHPVVRWDGHTKDHRVSIDDIRSETPEDVAKREHKARMTAWKKATPVIDPRILFFVGAMDVTGASLRGTLNTPAEFRDAARQLSLLADWFEKRPA